MAEAGFREWERLCELIWGCAISQAIHVCVDVGLPEILNAGPKSADQLAIDTGTDLWSLETTLRALTAFDVLSKEDGKYSLTTMGRLLLRSAPGSSASEAGEFFHTLYRPLEALSHAVRTGEVAFNHVFGKSFYDYLAENPGLASTFYDLMEANAPQRYAGLSAAYSFSGVPCVVDVGGGEGSLLAQILRENPCVKGVLFDLPIVATRAAARLEAAGLSGRCEIIPGDFRENVPSGGDVYILAQILNNWRDEEAIRILGNCRAAMDAKARLLILEPVVLESMNAGEAALPRWRVLVSLGVMAQRGGRTRSESQMRSLIAASGFELESIQQLSSNAICAITARRRE